MRKSDKTAIVANRKNTAFWTVLSFILPAGVMLVILAICGITPFGSGTLINESNGGWFDGFCGLYEIITQGESIFYRFNTGFGSSFYPDFASGLCTPFIFFTFFFPAKNLAAAYSVITVLRAGFSGLFAWFALNKISGAGKHFCFAMSCGYALCGFTACAAYYPSVADGAVFFPLFALGIYSYVCDSRPLKLFLFGALFFVTCPRLFISGIIFAFLFYGAFYFRRGSSNQRVYKLVMFAAMVICSAASAAALIFPLGAASAGDELFGDFTAVNPAAALCFGGYGILAEDGTYYLCMAGLLIMGVFLFVMNNKIHVGERLFMAAGIALTLCASAISPLGSFMYGFGGDSVEMINTGFVLVMISVYCTARAIAESDGIKIWNIVVSVALFVLLAGVSMIFGKSDVFALIADAGLAVVFAALFVKLCVDRHIPSMKMSAISAALLILFGVIHCGGSVSGIKSEYLAEKFSADLSERNSVSEEIDESEKLNDRSMGFFRSRSTDNPSVGGANLNANGNTGFIRLANNLGIIDESYAGGGENFTPLTDILFSVEYLANDGKITELHSVQSPAYVVSDSNNFTLVGENAFEFQNDAAVKWFGSDKIFRIVEYTHDGSFASSEIERYKWTFGNENTLVNKYTVSVGSGEGLYMLADGGNYRFAVNDDSLGAWRSGCDGGIYTLVQPGDERMTEVYIASEVGAEAVEPVFAVTTMEGLSQLKEKAIERGGEYISRRGNRIKFMLDDAEKDQLAVTSIPCEYGWNIKINGNDAETVEVCEGLIGIKLEEGSNSIIMEYRPPLFNVGLAISVIMSVMGLYIAIHTEHDIARRRKVKMAFKAVEINMNKQTGEAPETIGKGRPTDRANGKSNV